MSLPAIGLVVLLALATLSSALAVVYVRYQGRTEFITLQGLQHERDRMDAEWGRLQLELSTLADPGRIERIARRRLGMHRPDPVEVEVLVP